MNTVVFGFPGNERLTEALCNADGIASGRMTLGRFPDGETHLRMETEVGGRDVVLVCSLDRPDEKLVPLAFAAATARELGARRVGVVAPYLPYLRQDKVFQPGQSLSSAHFARLLCQAADWLVCMDPHLHRYKSLREIYSMPVATVHAAPAMAEWIAANVKEAVLFGPDDESEQWVAEVARRANAPFAILHKQRKSDTEVAVSLPHAGRWRGHTPVILDDIISSAGTMMAAVGMLRGAGLAAPVCIGVHAVFAAGAYAKLQVCGAADVVTCNTIQHSSNAIDVHPIIAEGVRAFLR